MKILSDVLKDIRVREIIGEADRKIGEPEIDSRKIKTNGVFIALKGTITDGHKFIEIAIQNGAKTILCSDLPGQPAEDVTWVVVDDTAQACGPFVHAYFDHPSTKLQLIGITGTNGKTTTATLLFELLNTLDGPCGLLSTVENRIGDEVLPSTHTTPDPVTLNRLLLEMVEGGCKFASMEVSSHAIDQQRIGGLQFAGGVFTNITHDHLDYHGTFRHYLDTKKKFFDGLGARAFALVNADDPRGEFMVQNTQAKVSKYSLRKLTEFKAKIQGNDMQGLHLQIGENEVMSRLVGEFNAYNLLAVYGTAVELGFDRQEVLTVLSGLRPVDGRFDILRDTGRNVSAVVDYAHTPDALQKVLGTLQKVKGHTGRLWVVVGCGGDRDRAKRPKMGQIASEMADMAVFTSDNPRSEDPDAIIEDMLEGVPPGKRDDVLIISKREEAIKTALRVAQKGDVVLIAGKGHEKYQEIKGERFPFDDKQVVRNALQKNI